MLIKEKHITRMGVGPLCRLFGKSRQAFYHRKHSFLEKEQQELIVLELVAQAPPLAQKCSIEKCGGVSVPSLSLCLDYVPAGFSPTYT